MNAPGMNTSNATAEKNDPQNYSNLLRTALLEIERMESRMQEAERATTAPIAVIGFGCRFPGGANNPQTYWDNLCKGLDAVTEVPQGRWNLDDYRSSAGLNNDEESFCRYAAFLDNVDRFDAEFFGISPREARMIDPQQRLLLQVSWEALENAGIAPSRLNGTDTGVFVGVMSMDYSQYLSDHTLIDLHTITGHALSSSAGRLSYFLGAHGPSLTIDTACSSSLVTVHQACQSLRTGECTLALAGGINMILTPANTLAECRAKMLSPSGKCRTFDNAADGMVRGEGCGIVVLKRLSDAVRDGDPVLATIYGSAVNHDGSSSGLTVPNPLAQEKLFLRALKNAGADPAQISYIETHGTGTSLGDPIEVASISSIYLKGRTAENPLIIGSVKTNLGHLEAASGIAGFIKLVLSIQHKTIPKHLHFTTPNSRIPWQELALQVPAETMPWPSGAAKRMAGISSFGLTGTNAHMILGEADQPVTSNRKPALPWQPVTLSAKSGQALTALVQQYAQYLGSSGESLEDIAYTANHGRSHFSYRLAFVADSVEMLQRQLTHRLAGEEAAGRKGPQKKPGAGRKIAFLFTGQGSQYPNMYREIYELHPEFRQVVDQADDYLKSFLDASLLQLIFSNEEQDDRLRETIYTQPVLFVLEYALAKLWMSWGVRPDFVLGHSVGEYVAACVAGVFSFEDGLKLIAARGKLMQALPKGKMTAVFAEKAVVAGLIQNCGGRVSIAAVNGPSNTVISGTPEWIDHVEKRADELGIKTKALDVSHAFHSMMMNPVLAPFKAVAETIRYSTPQLGIVSNITGTAVREEMANADYWVNHILATVRFSQGMETLFDEKADLFLEVGPSPVLISLGKSLASVPEDALWLPSIVRHGSNWKTLLETLGKMYVQGVNINWQGYYQHHEHKSVSLPTYPFQEKRYWLREARPATAKDQPLKNVVVAYYNAVAGSSFFDTLSGTPFLTFGLFPEIVEGFSWVLVQAFPQRYPQYTEMALQAQKELRDLLFEGVDFQACRNVLDIGCGFGSDLISLAGQYRHLRFHGYNISDGQARLANAKVVERDLHHRISIFNRDSANDPFPGDYDLVFGLEVAHHIRDKKALFDNIHRHINDGGWLVLADFISNTEFSIDHHESSSYFIQKEEWEQLFSEHGFELVSCIDVSREISNFIFDPLFDEHLKQLKESEDENIRIGFKSYDQLGKLLHKGLASYVLFTARKSDRADRTQNRQKLAALTPYRRTLAVDTYTIKWQANDTGNTGLHSLQKENPPERWLLFSNSDQDPLTEAVSRLFALNGQQLVRVFHGNGFRKQNEHTYEPDFFQKKDIRELFQRLSAGESFKGILYLPEGPHDPSGEKTPDWYGPSLRVLELVQAVLETEGMEKPKLWLVTRGVHTIGREDEAGNFGLMPVWSLARVIALEHSALWGGIVDLPPVPAKNDLDQLYHTVKSPGKEDQQALRNGKIYVPRLTPYKLPAYAPVAFSATDYFLITGALGALGMQLARWMATHGARHLILLYRQDPVSEQKQAFLAELRQAGVQLKLFCCDVADENAMTRLFEELAKDKILPKGIFHLAGALDDGVLALQTAERFEKVMAPKVLGAWHLHLLTQQTPLDFFVCFSSMASVLGSPGQGNYAAGNGFLDGLANYRQSLGLPGLSINWGHWKEVGMTSALAQKQKNRLEQLGLTAFDADQGLNVLEAVLKQEGLSQIAVANLDWSRLQKYSAFVPVLNGRNENGVKNNPSPDKTENPVALLHQLRNADKAAQHNLICAYVKKTVSEIMDFEESELDADKTFIELGIDSLMAVELKNNLTREFKIEIPVVRLLEGATVNYLADCIQEALQQPANGEPQALAKLQDTAEPISPEKARELLARLDDLSEEETERLLKLTE